MSQFVARQSPVGEVLPNNPEGPEQRGYRPDYIHDPHVLRVAQQIETNESGAGRTKREVSNGQIMEPKWNHRKINQRLGTTATGTREC